MRSSTFSTSAAVAARSASWRGETNTPNRSGPRGVTWLFQYGMCAPAETARRAFLTSASCSGLSSPLESTEPSAASAQ